MRVPLAIFIPLLMTSASQATPCHLLVAPQALRIDQDATVRFENLLRQAVERKVIGISELSQIIQSEKICNPFSAATAAKGYHAVAEVVRSNENLDWRKIQTVASTLSRQILDRKSAVDSTVAETRQALSIVRTGGIDLSKSLNQDRAIFDEGDVAPFYFDHQHYVLLKQERKILLANLSKRTVRRLNLRISASPGPKLHALAVFSKPFIAVRSQKLLGETRMIVGFDPLTGEEKWRIGNGLSNLEDSSFAHYEDEQDAVVLVGKLGSLGIVNLRASKPEVQWIAGDPDTDYDAESRMNNNLPFARIYRDADGKLKAFLLIKKMVFRPTLLEYARLAVFNLTDGKFQRERVYNFAVRADAIPLRVGDQTVLVAAEKKTWDKTVTVEQHRNIVTIDMDTLKILDSRVQDAGFPAAGPLYFKNGQDNGFFFYGSDMSVSGNILNGGKIRLDQKHVVLPFHQNFSYGAVVINHEGQEFALMGLADKGEIGLIDLPTGRLLQVGMYNPEPPKDPNRVPFMYGEKKFFTVWGQSLDLFRIVGGG
jgi:hypothetical protein